MACILSQDTQIVPNQRAGLNSYDFFIDEAVVPQISRELKCIDGRDGPVVIKLVRVQLLSIHPGRLQSHISLELQVAFRCQSILLGGRSSLPGGLSGPSTEYRRRDRHDETYHGNDATDRRVDSLI